MKKGNLILDIQNNHRKDKRSINRCTRFHWLHFQLNKQSSRQIHQTENSHRQIQEINTRGAREGAVYLNDQVLDICITIS